METNIFLFMLLAAASVQNNGQASPKAIDAYLKYTGIDKQLDASLNNLKHEIPEESRFYIGNGIFIAKTIIDRRIVVEWSFK